MNLFSGRTGANYEPQCPHYDTREENHGEAGDGIWYQAGTWYTICNDCGTAWIAESDDQEFYDSQDGCPND